jgi:predicted outer membrane repeat protein
MYNNKAHSNGGGVYARESSPKFTNVTIRENTTAGNGGGVLVHMYSQSVNMRKGPVFTNCEISGNTANSGGGFAIVGNDERPQGVIRNNCLISGNTATTTGGGIYTLHSYNANNLTHWFTAVAVNNTFITDNTANNGGGIYNNKVARNASAISPEGTETGIYLRLSNVTIAGNTAANGGGIYNYNADTNIFVTANNSVIWENTGTQNIYDNNSKIEYDHCLVQGLTLNGGSGASVNYTTGAGNLDPDANFPIFTPEYYPGSGSDLINQGDNGKVISAVGSDLATGDDEILTAIPTWPSLNHLKSSLATALSDTTLDFDLTTSTIEPFSSYLNPNSSYYIGDKRGTYNDTTGSFDGTVRLTMPPRDNGSPVDIGAYEAP